MRIERRTQPNRTTPKNTSVIFFLKTGSPQKPPKTIKESFTRKTTSTAEPTPIKMFFPAQLLIRRSLINPVPRLNLKSTGSSQKIIRQSSLITIQRAYSAGHAADESFSAFNERYTQFFEGVQDLFELQRGLNNCFAYDLVPAVPTVEAALRAARRVNDLPTAIRIFEGLKEKVENKGQYQAYLDELKPLRDELGVPTKEEMYGQAI
ncbi:Cytochrome c oxidase subunit 6 [Puccinia graminis f. sp. tritici]|nr:Cytochrome c oxidase subunit 6 [Puccinia graminis f. sp. tritici]